MQNLIRPPFPSISARQAERRAQELGYPMTRDSEWLEESEEAAKDSGGSHPTLEDSGFAGCVRGFGQAWCLANVPLS